MIKGYVVSFNTRKYKTIRKYNYLKMWKVKTYLVAASYDK